MLLHESKLMPVFFIYVVYSFSCVIMILEMSENCANGPADIDSLGERFFRSAVLFSLE